MKQKIQCEIEIEADCEMEFVGVRRGEEGEYRLASGRLTCCDRQTIYQYPIFRPVEPPLELETDTFMQESWIESSYVFETYDNKAIGVEYDAIASPAEARDLAKILNYWAEKGKLPKVKLRGAE